MIAAFAYHLDAASPRTQSGRPYSMLRQFRKMGVDVLELFPLAEVDRQRRKLIKLWNHLQGREYLIDRDDKLLRGFAEQLHAALGRTSADFLFSPSTLPLSYLETDLPMTFCADAPFCAMKGYYKSFSRLSPGQIDLAEQLEAGVLQRAALAVYPTRWAAEAAMHHYGISPDRVAEIPFGANLGNGNRREEVERWIEQRGGPQPLRLLFVGREWERKGGDLVLATAEWLQRRGMNVAVDVAGSGPWRRRRTTLKVHWHGDLNPRDPVQRAKLAGLFQKTHFIFVPSRAEAYGMTFCEANAFGVPAATTATGGISGIVRNGVNGVALPPGSPPEAYGAWIEENASDPARYAELASSSFREFETRLNWDTHCRVFMERVEGLKEVRPADAATSVPDIAAAPATQRPLRAAFVADTYTDPTNIHSWSGTPYFAKRALERQGVQFTVLRLDERSARIRRWANFLWYRLVLRKRYIRDRHPCLLRAFGRQIRKQLGDLRPDLVFSMATGVVSYLDADCPIVFWVDATFASMSDFYRSFSNLAKVSVRDTDTSDREALARSALAIYSSEWAAESARSKYPVEPRRVHFVNLGANLDHAPGAGETAAMIGQRDRTRCRLLFIGVDWERKGADRAVAITAALKTMGVDAQLTIIGCQPPPGTTVPAFVQLVGFLSKQTEEGSREIARHFQQSHFFVLPTHAEAYGMVFCEAGAFGLPSIAPRVGGIPSIIEDGVNGWLMPPDATPEQYAEVLAERWKDRAAYEAMAKASRRVYDERLNWDAAAARVAALMRECVDEWKTSTQRGRA